MRVYHGSYTEILFLSQGFEEYEAGVFDKINIEDYDALAISGGFKKRNT